MSHAFLLPISACMSQDSERTCRVSLNFEVNGTLLCIGLSEVPCKPQYTGNPVYSNLSTQLESLEEPLSFELCKDAHARTFVSSVLEV